MTRAHRRSDTRFCFRVLLILAQLLCLLLGSSLVNASPRIITADSQPRILLNKRVASEVDISGYLEVLEDASGRRTLNEILEAGSGFRRNGIDGLQTSLGRNVYWIRGRVSRSLTDPSDSAEWLLLVGYPHIAEAQLFIPGEDVVPLERGIFFDRMPVFPLKLEKGSTVDFYLRLQVDGMANIPIRIWHKEAYLKDQRMGLPAWGLLAGGLLALVMYNFFIFLSLREPIYLHLSAFLLVMLLVMAVQEGFAGMLIAARWPALVTRLDQTASLVSMGASILFTRSFLATSRTYPALDRLYRVCQWIAFVLAASNLILPLGSAVMQPAFWCLVLVFASATALAALSVSDRAIRFFVMGWAILFMAFVVFQLAQFGVLPVNQYTLYGKAAAMCCLGVLLSLGLAAQIQKERFEKQQALLRQQEIVQELRNSEDQLQKKLLRDTLRGFPGIDTLKQALDDAIQASRSVEQPVVLVLLELDHTEEVARQLGTSARDELVTRATKRLSVILRGVSGVMPLGDGNQQYIPMAVLGEGSYGFVLRGMANATINHAIEEVEASMMRPFYYQEIRLQPGISFGLARLGEQGDDVESLWQHAQRSLQAGLLKNRGRQWDFAGQQDSVRNIAAINALRAAMYKDQISLYFQPVYDLRRQRMCAVELQSRWEPFGQDKLRSDEIFHLAEVGGFVSELTIRLLDRALVYFVQILNPAFEALTLTVNLSPKCLRDESFLNEVELLLSKHRLPARYLAFEIRESAIIEDPSMNAEVLNRIRAMGIGLAIDEFGATYSNPSYLSGVPVSEVKLDWHLVASLAEPEVQATVMLLISLCADQHIRLVAQGVEDEATLLQLEQMGCKYAQGHYLSVPMLARDFKLPRNRFTTMQFQRA